MSTDIGDLDLREISGLLTGTGEAKIKLVEAPADIFAETKMMGCRLRPDEARWYARKLYWLARRIDARAKAALPPTPRGEG